jgi:hypothetical protein
LEKQHLKLGIIDTLTGGQLARELLEGGFGHLITANLCPASLREVLKDHDLDSGSDLRNADNKTLAASLAESVTPDGGLGLALLGPFSDNTTCVALHGRDDIDLYRPGRNYQDSDYTRQWLVLQGLDWIRRVVSGQLTSPVDWK